MGLFSSPLPPLVLAALLRSTCDRRGSGWLAVALVWYGAWLAWRWWCHLVITIDGVPYKENSRSRAAAGGGAHGSIPGGGGHRKKPTHDKPSVSTKDGFCTPASSEAADDSPGGRAEFSVPPVTAEWAPFSPSLPYGEQPAPAAPAPPLPYWLECDASIFDVRNIRYKQTREKVPSDFALYDCVGMDMIRDRRRIDSLIDRVPREKLPAAGALPKSPAGAPEWTAAWGVPRVVVVNCQLPYKAGWLMGAHPEEDGGLSVCNYFVLSKGASELLAKGQATPALSLWRRFVEEGVSSKEGVSFKVAGRVEDLDGYEVPESFHRFNNKPVLLTKSSRVVSTRLPEVIEIDYDVRSWVYPARTALTSYHHRAAEAELEIGYLVEGKADDELPEQILGCFKLNNMDMTQAQWVSIM